MIKKRRKWQNILTYEVLHRLYTLENKSLETIGKIYDAHPFTISRWLRKLNIKVRKMGYNGCYNNPDYLKKQARAHGWNYPPKPKPKRIKQKDYLKSDKNPIYEYQFKKGEGTALLNKNPKFIKKRLKGLIKKPNKKEKLLNRILQRNFPNDWKYVGDGNIIIDSLNPDFINCNGKKLIIELFGDYWHSENRQNMTIPQREKRFAKYGYKMLVIWESELKNLNEVLNRIKKFDGGK